MDVLARYVLFSSLSGSMPFLVLDGFLMLTFNQLRQCFVLLDPRP